MSSIISKSLSLIKEEEDKIFLSYDDLKRENEQLKNKIQIIMRLLKKYRGTCDVSAPIVVSTLPLSKGGNKTKRKKRSKSRRSHSKSKRSHSKSKRSHSKSKRSHSKSRRSHSKSRRSHSKSRR